MPKSVYSPNTKNEKKDVSFILLFGLLYLQIDFAFGVREMDRS